MGVILNEARTPSKVGDGVLHSHGKGLLEAGNEIVQDEATLVHNEGQLDAPCL